jgi:putative Holliday junction resolvase
MPNDSSTAEALRKLCEREGVVEIVIGLPRGLEGQDTAQTAVARSAGMELARQLDLPTSWQDEALTSAQAEAELKSRGKPYAKGDIDALAATYILEDYLREKV